MIDWEFDVFSPVNSVGYWMILNLSNLLLVGSEKLYE